MAQGAKSNRVCLRAVWVIAPKTTRFAAARCSRNRSGLAWALQGLLEGHSAAFSLRPAGRPGQLREELLRHLQAPPGRQAWAATSVSPNAGWARSPCQNTGRASFFTSRSRPGLPTGLGGDFGHGVRWLERHSERQFQCQCRQHLYQKKSEVLPRVL